jgi:hypothetical protein
MTFIGIAIFTVYYQLTAWRMPMTPEPCEHTPTHCMDDAHKVTEEQGRYEPVYVGEFDSLDACDKAVSKTTYKLKPGERLDWGTEILCVPKT